MKKQILSLLARAPSFALVAWTTMAAFSQTPEATGSCSPLPPINTAKGFIYNFNNPCYAQTMASGNGWQVDGDVNAQYSQVFYQTTPGYGLVIIGTYPNARFMSIAAYDTHLATVGSLIDYSVVPISSTTINPYEAGAHWIPGQQWAATVSLDGNLPSSYAPGCGVGNSAVNTNFMNVSQIHSGLTWNGATDLPAGFPVHQTGPNNAGNVMVRKYLDIADTPVPVVIVRQLSNGCAIPVSQAISQGIISVKMQVQTSLWLNQTQINSHNQYSNSYEPTYCYPPDPQNQVQWIRSSDYVSRNNPAAYYLNGAIPLPALADLLQGQEYLRIRFPLPSVPDIPCATGDCSLTGKEQLRYLSISFEGGTNVITTLYDGDFVRDPNGNVTLIVGLGAPQPPQATSANYYTWIDLSQSIDYQSLSSLRLRNFIPNATFSCSTSNVPILTSEYNLEGGFMGPYVPTVDFPTAFQIPQTPAPVSRPNSCLVVPVGQPTSCPTQIN